MMLTKKRLIGLATAGALAVTAVPAMAQVTGGSQQVDVYVGEAFGDDVTDTRLTGRQPKLDDDLTYGLRYGLNLTDTWGLEMSVGRTDTSVTGLPAGNTDLDLTTFDVDAIYHFNTHGPFVPYVTAGLGYANADLDRPLIGTANGNLVRIEDDNGFTLNAGIGAKYFFTDTVSLRLDARYRYLDKVVDRFDDSLNTFETTLGVGFQF
jgi:OOP family OmpA-OmpF porin